MSKSPVAAASATYRKTVNDIADALGVDPAHTRYPSLDLEDAVAGIPDAMKDNAIEWYVRGIKRGMAKATDMMLNGDIYLEEGTVYAPETMKVKVRTRMNGGDWERLVVSVSCHEIGFK